MLTRTIAGRTFTYSRCLGRGAASGEGFQNPVDIALGSNNMMYVLNRPDERNPNTRIGKFDLGNNPGDEQYLMEWGTRGDEDGQFMAVTSMVMDKNENLYVADELLNRISIFDTEGNFLSKWGASGSGDGELDRPWGLALDNDENLYVVDMGNSRVQKFSKDGQYLASSGARKAPAKASSTCLGESPLTPKAASMWPTGTTPGCRSSLPTAAT